MNRSKVRLGFVIFAVAVIVLAFYGGFILSDSTVPLLAFATVLGLDLIVEGMKEVVE